MYIRSRREFLRDTLQSVTALGAVGGMAKFGEMNALAAGGSGYQALVCIFLSGGNDGHNTVIPISTAQQNYSLYQQGAAGLALPQAGLLPIANGGDVYGLHPSLVEIQGLYNQGKAAVLANVGMLVQPITRAAYLTNNSAIMPNALFSHSDQADQWQTAIPNGIATQRLGRAHHRSTAGAEHGRHLSRPFPPLELRPVLHRPADVSRHRAAAVSGFTGATGMATLNGHAECSPSTRRACSSC